MDKYLGDLFVLAILAIIIFGIIVPIIKLLFKKDWSNLLKVIGPLLIIGAIPATFMAGLSINGCCGAQPSGYEGIEYVIGGLMVIGGIAAIIYGKKLS